MATRSPWELFQAGEEPRDLRGDVLTSWRRSRFSGVDPEHVEVPYVATELDTAFARVAVPIMAGTADLLGGDSSCLALSDERGSVIWRWVSEPMLRDTLDDLRVVEGFCFDEEFVGTNGLGTALETGSLAVVRGTEHYVQRFHDVTCVAAPVRHPVTRRTVGAVNVTCRAADTTSLLTVVVRKLVGEIHTALLDHASQRERRLLDAFLAAQRRENGPVAVVGDGVLITNAAAGGLGLDRLDLWDELRSLKRDGTTIGLPADLTARVELVRAGGATAGAVLTVSGPDPRTVTAVPRRPAAPRTDPWTAATERVAELASAGPVAVRGEAGTGKTTVLAGALGGAPTVLDAATYATEGPGAWTGRLRAALRTGDPLILRHTELLDVPAARTIAAILTDPAGAADHAEPVPRGAPSGHIALRECPSRHPVGWPPPAGRHPVGRSPVGLTVTVSDGEAPAAGAGLLCDALGAATVTLPPLRSRPDDVGRLAQDLLRTCGDGPSFAPDALAALRRHYWPGNLAELARVVTDAAAGATGPAVTATALPADVRAAATRAGLSPLQVAEARVIAATLHAHGGNKSTAARELGISRTALYSKIRTYRI